MVNFSATSASSGCLEGVEFAYYLEPQVMHVAPITGPRYGSFDLRVQLEESVASFADAVSAAEHDQVALVAGTIMRSAVQSLNMLQKSLLLGKRVPKRGHCRRQSAVHSLWHSVVATAPPACLTGESQPCSGRHSSTPVLVDYRFNSLQPSV